MCADTGVHQVVGKYKIGRPAARTLMEASLVTRELLSALADDQLGQKACSGLLEACKLDESALDCWTTYHLIGDHLRLPAGPHMAVRVRDELAFVHRLRKGLARETAIMSTPVLVEFSLAVRTDDQRKDRDQAANDSSFRWKVVAGVASLVAVAAIAWNASGLLPPSSLPQLAQAPAPQIVVTSPQGPVVRDLKLEELLTAHRQFGSATALQESSGFLRNATFELPRDTPSGSGR